MEGTYIRFLEAVEFGELKVKDLEFCSKIQKERDEDCGLNLDKIDKWIKQIKEKGEFEFLEWTGLENK